MFFTNLFCTSFFWRKAEGFFFFCCLTVSEANRWLTSKRQQRESMLLVRLHISDGLDSEYRCLELRLFFDNLLLRIDIFLRSLFSPEHLHFFAMYFCCRNKENYGVDVEQMSRKGIKKNGWMNNENQLKNYLLEIKR